LSMSNCYKLHKNRPSGFFAQKPLKNLIKLCHKFKSIHWSATGRSGTVQAYTQFNILNLQTHSEAELMQLFLPATMQGIT
jgi:hypothetical protein